MNPEPPTTRLLTRLPDILAWLWTALVLAGLVGFYHARNFDDPYITYRYAANLARGAGFVYNEGERVLSTTAPFYALILAGAAKAGLDIPLTGNLLGCISLALGGLAFWYLGKVWRTPLVGGVGLLLLPTSHILITTLGGEIPFVIALVLFGFLACAHQRAGWAAFLLALAMLTRADGGLAAGCGGAYLLLTALAAPDWRRRLWRTVVPYGVLFALFTVPWFLAAWSYFGTPLPGTLAAKQYQGMMEDATLFFPGFLHYGQAYWEDPLFRSQLALAGVGLVLLLLLVRLRPWLLVLTWNLLYLAAYSWLGVPHYFWYYGPVVVGLVALVGCGVAWAGGEMSRRGRGWWRDLVAGSLTLLVLFPHISLFVTLKDTNDTRLGIYREVGEWLRTHTPPEASVGTLEVGIIGYYAQRRMIDFAGLIQPEVARRLPATETYAESTRWAFQHFRPDYLVLHSGPTPGLANDAVFQSACREVKTFENGIYDHPLVVYDCRGGERLERGEEP
jgi:hypothetical protein